MMARPPGPLYVFGYGSLIWNPCFEARESRCAVLAGWRRRTCLWTVGARGSPEAPGLFYALDADETAACHGVALGISEETAEADLRALWDREMHAGIYVARWLPLDTPDGDVTALAFTVRHDHPQFAGDLPVDDAARYIHRAVGRFGPNAEYYRATYDHLRELDLDDADLAAVVAALDALDAGG